MPRIATSAVPKICTSLGVDDADELERLSQLAMNGGAKLFEIRLDALPDPRDGLAVIRAIRERDKGVVVIATCRSEAARGKFSEGIDEQLEVLSDAVANGASLVDLEIESAEQCVHKVSELRKQVLLIVSYHDLDETPELGGVLGRLQQVDADFYKIACKGIDYQDVGRTLDFLGQSQESNLIVLSIGELGACTRILGPAYGAVFTYAKSGDASAPSTADGQLTADELTNIYRIHEISDETKQYGFACYPVWQSPSPAMHNAAFRAAGLDARYLPFPVPDGIILDSFMKFARAKRLDGFNVGMPNKVSIMRYLDHVDETATAVGAVNTVYRVGGELHATNTDVDGVRKCLDLLGGTSLRSALVVGNGGAARSCLYVLRELGIECSITGRNMTNISQLADKLSICPLTPVESCQERFDLLVNATPLGMRGDLKDQQLLASLPAGAVFDVVYDPPETSLVSSAKALGHSTVSGLTMLVEQGAHAFNRWVGSTPPSQVMREAAEAFLREQAIQIARRVASN